MRHRFTPLLLVSLAAMLPAHAKTELTLMSYNIRLDVAGDGPNRWDLRKEQLTAQVATLAPTILGIQEGLAQQVDYLEAELPDYAYTGVGRDDAQRAGEFSALFYRKDRAELIESSTFWLSETPDIPSFGWGANYRRICTYGHFRDLETQATYWVFNTHFDHESDQARLNGARLILERIDSVVGHNEAYFVMGDLNASPESPPIRMFSDALADTRIHSLSTPFGPHATFNGFDTATPPTQRIDYIFASPGNTTVTAYATHSDLANGRYPSDHFAVLAEVQIHDQGAPNLKISPDRRHLVTEAGASFFWLGDTAWELFHRLTLEEAEHYLDVRAAQGFNVIQAVILAEQSGLTIPNANGDLPLHDIDPTRPNEAYFYHVDAIVTAANRRGITIGLLPTWGDKFNKKWGTGPEIFTPENAETYARFLGQRYAHASIVWILGGDRIPEEPEDFAIIEAMARGIRATDTSQHLITYHPQGRQSSSRYFHQADWLDLNLHQSGHGERNYQNFKDTLADASLTPAKPVLDGEPCYEDIPIGFKVENGWFTAFESRRAGYWSLLAGAAGHTYGHHSVWQMWQTGRHPILDARTPWQEAIYYPGAYQAGYMLAAFESVDWQNLAPAQDLLLTPSTVAEKPIRIAATSGRTTVLAYAPYGQAFTLKLPSPAPSNARWFNPRDGTSIPFISDPTHTFDPPADEEHGNDWLLILTSQKP